MTIYDALKASALALVLLGLVYGTLFVAWVFQ